MLDKFFMAEKKKKEKATKKIESQSRNIYFTKGESLKCKVKDKIEVLLRKDNRNLQQKAQKGGSPKRENFGILMRK